MRVVQGRVHTSFESKMDMTPLIDIIFQLILFLVLTSQITIQAEEVELPFALEGKELEKDKTEVPPILINVVRKASDDPSEERMGVIVVDGEEFKDDRSGAAQQKLAKKLKREVDYDASPDGRNRGFEPGPNNRQLSKLTVLVRADQGVRAEYVRTIFMACQDVGIYRIKISTTQPQP